MFILLDLHCEKTSINNNKGQLFKNDQAKNGCFYALHYYSRRLVYGNLKSVLLVPSTISELSPGQISTRHKSITPYLGKAE